jgi:hypothetical protein
MGADRLPNGIDAGTGSGPSGYDNKSVITLRARRPFYG